MAKNIEKLLEELAKESGRIILSPKALEELKSQGINFSVLPPLTIDELFEQRRKNAKEKVLYLPELPVYLPPIIQSLYKEIRECIFFDLNGPAITMSSILIEYVIKYATYIKEVGGYGKPDMDKWDEFEDIELSKAINRAKKAGLLDSKMAKRLNLFREIFRNPYSHYNIKKITKDVVAEKVKRLNVTTQQIEVIDINAVDDHVIQAEAKPFMDKKNVLSVFHFADEVVKHLLSKI